MSNILLILFVVGILILVFKFFSKTKMPKINSLTMITGGVKAGKSTFSVCLAIKTYQKNLREVKIKNFFARLFGKPLEELPLLYSNVPLGVPYVKLTRDLLLMQTRFAHKSVCYIQEASLVADSMLFKKEEINNKLVLFYKLFAHITKGGSCIVDSQAIGDVHHSLKKSLSNYFYIHHTEKKYPFFIVVYVRELLYSEDGSVVNNFNEDVEDSLKKVWISKSTWKKFNRYCFYSFVEDKSVDKRVIPSDINSDLTCYDIVSFRPEFNIRLNEVSQNKKLIEMQKIRNDLQNKIKEDKLNDIKTKNG